MKLFFIFLGLALGLWISLDFSAWPLIGVLLFFGLTFFAAKKKKVVLFFLSAAILGVGLGCIKIKGEERSGEFQGFVIESQGDHYVLYSNFARYYVYEKDTNREIGDFLSVTGKSYDYVVTTYESRFDYGEYLAKKGIYKQITAYKTVSQFQNPIRLRAYEFSFLSHFDKETSLLMDSILFNRKDYDAGSLQKADGLNLLPLFSSSGIFFSLLLRLASKGISLKLDDKKTSLLVLGIGALALPFGITKIGILRVYLCRILSFCNIWFWKKRFDYLERTSLAGLFLLSLERHFVYQSGFLIGFAACFILYFFRGSMWSKSKKWKGFYPPFLIYLLLIPTTLSGGGGFHIFQFLFNAVALPISSLYYLSSLFCFVIYPIAPLMNGFTSFINYLLNFFSIFDFVLPVPALSGLTSLIYYLVYIAILFFDDLRVMKVRNGLAFLSVSLYGISLIPAVPYFSQSVTFINVGQGDCILIQDGLKTAMIDTGGNIHFDMAKEALIPYLRERRIYHIDYLIESHGDYDHVGAASSLMENFQVNQLVSGPSEFPLKVSDSLTFYNYNVYSDFICSGDENETSLFLSLDFIGKKWLFTGDAPSELEKRVIKDHPDLDCDILKAGHHGSKTASSLDFLKTVTPETAIISVGAKNSYGHPDEEVIARLESLHIEIRRTDLEGSILYRQIKPL